MAGRDRFHRAGKAAQPQDQEPQDREPQAAQDQDQEGLEVYGDSAYGSGGPALSTATPAMTP